MALIYAMSLKRCPLSQSPSLSITRRCHFAGHKEPPHSFPTKRVWQWVPRIPVLSPFSHCTTSPDLSCTCPGGLDPVSHPRHVGAEFVALLLCILGTAVKHNGTGQIQMSNPNCLDPRRKLFFPARRNTVPTPPRCQCQISYATLGPQLLHVQSTTLSNSFLLCNLGTHSSPCQIKIFS